MVNAPKKNLSPLPAGTYGKLTKHSTRQLHQVNKGKSGLDAERVRVLGALRNLRSKKMLVSQKRLETHFFSNEERETWIEDFVEREATVARKRVHDAKTGMMQEQEHMGHVERDHRQPQSLKYHWMRC
jgi:hypothetical protein